MSVDARWPLRIGGVLRCCIATLDAIGPPASMTKEGDTLSCSYCPSGLIVRDGAWEWWKDKPTEGVEMTSTICPGSNGRPAELVILDIGPWDPPGTCPVCGRSFGMKGWVIPEHEGAEKGSYGKPLD